MRAQKSTFRPQSGQLSFHSTNIPRSMMEATSANTINRVLTTGATPPMPWADQDLGLGEQMGSNHQGTTGASVYVANRAACPRAPPGRRRAAPNARARGQRGRLRASARRAERAAGGVRGRCAASARAPERGCVGWGGREAGGGGGGAPEPRGRAGLAPREQIGVEETPGSRPEARELGLSTAGLRGRPPRLAPEVAAAPGDSQ